MIAYCTVLCPMKVTVLALGSVVHAPGVKTTLFPLLLPRENVVSAPTTTLHAPVLSYAM